MSRHIADKWDESILYDDKYLAKILEDGKFFIPSSIDRDWVVSNQVLFTKELMWKTMKKKFNLLNDKTWVYNVYISFKSEEIKVPIGDMLVHMEKLYPDIYTLLHIEELDESETQVALKLKKQVRCNDKCLSSITLSDNDHGRIFSMISEETDVKVLLKNASIENDKKVFELHKHLMDLLIESVCGRYPVKPSEHNKIVQTEKLKKDEKPTKFIYGGDLKKMKKFMKIDISDPCCPPPGNKWSKASIKKVVENNKKFFEEIKKKMLWIIFIRIYNNFRNIEDIILCCIESKRV